MSFDLLNIGKEGILAHQQSLQTTSKNINNANTPSYVRERTEYAESQFGGLEKVRVERMIDQYTTRQLRTDTSNVAFYEASLEQAEQLDSLLGNSTTNIASSVESFFNTLQDANNDPGSVTARQLVISEADAMVTKFNDFSSYLDDQKQIINDRLKLSTSRINSLASNIGELNERIANSSQRDSGSGDINALLNKRDDQLLQLSELVEFQSLESKSGAVTVNLKNGQPLVLENGEFNAVAVKSDPNTERLELSLQKRNSTGNVSEFLVKTEEIGGAVGGYLDYRDDTLLPTQQRLGQMAVRVADSLNNQNQKGMDLDNQLGQKLFDLSQVKASGFPDSKNTGNQTVSISVLEGNSTSFPSENIEIGYEGGGQYYAIPLETDGTHADGADKVTFKGAANSSVDIEELGITVNLGGGTPVENDSFLVKPSESAASEIELVIRRPEDVALASPVRTINDMDNQGAAEIELSQVNSPDDFYNAAGNDLLATSPAEVQIVGVTGDKYDVRLNDANGNQIGTTLQTTDLDNVIKQVFVADGLGSASGPDYDINIVGEPAAGDSYRIEYNRNGFDDNSNGQKLTELQREQLVRRDGGEEAEPTMTFNESYSRMVSDVGSQVSQNRVLRDSAEAVKDQTQALYESKSGVNLEEEAANLIQYQQAYTASARIISTSQTIFDTLLRSLG